MFHSDLFNTSTIEEQVNITPTELFNIDTVILDKLKKKLEGYCTQFGYIREVVSIESKENNPKLNDNGNGDCVIKVTILVNRCLPKKGQIIKCKITADDEHMGVFISFEEPIFISIINTTTDELHIDDIVDIKIEDFQLKHNDSIINIMSSYVSPNEELNIEEESEEEEISIEKELDDDDDESEVIDEDIDDESEESDDEESDDED